MNERKPILTLDFDGVIHSYQSGWMGADVARDPPVPGAAEFISEAVQHFVVHIYSSRSHETQGVLCMQKYVRQMLIDEFQGDGFDIFEQIVWPMQKSPAFVTLDDRALTFDGTWPSIEALKAFQPWFKR